jgi:hypothetical protein
MVALEALNTQEVTPRRRDHLRLVPAAYSTATYRVGSNLTARRSQRRLVLQRRRRVAVCLLAGLALTFLVVSQDPSTPRSATVLSNSSALTAGQTYVVQGGETLSTIARLVNPEHPSIALASLQKQIGSTVVIPGEHLLIP